MMLRITSYAGVVESVDTQHLKCCEQSLVWVQVPFPAQNKGGKSERMELLLTIVLRWYGLEKVAYYFEKSDNLY